MKNENKDEWNTLTFKWQELVHTSEYQTGKSDLHHYNILEHEAVLLFNRFTGEEKIIKHKKYPRIEK